jgi:putative Ca2+/H+ antiporter (TMEM165/GDT1 family)
VGSLLAALGIVFVAELGDKTQLVALGLGTRHRLVPVLVGITLGYAVVNLLSVVVGGLLGAALPTRLIGVAGGVLFLGFAVWILSAREAPTEAPDESASPVAPSLRRSAILSSAGAIFVAELGDKTMLATATLAADGNPALVWVGATIGITLSGTLGVFLGRVVGHQLPERATRLFAAALFAVFGVVLIATNV